jgi:predicted nucleic acid-binding protein
VTVIVDASIVAAALIDPGPTGGWAESVLASNALAAPHLMPAEVASVLRTASLAGDISADAAALAHADLLALRVELFPYAPFAERVWELRPNVTPYDAWYVALAEELQSGLATLDSRLRKAPGTRCEFLLQA